MLKIYGSSDDLIEIEGDIEEEYANNDFYKRKTYIAMSNALIVNIHMDEHTGDWRAVIVANPNSIKTETINTYGDDQGIVIHDDVTWVAIIKRRSLRTRGVEEAKLDSEVSDW